MSDATRAIHACLAAASLLVTPTASANTHIVTSLANDGAGSLREVIALTNSTPADDTIEFLPGLSGSIVVNDSLEVYSGGGALRIDGDERITLDGNNARPLISNGTNLTLVGLTLTRGLNFIENGGGAIYSIGALRLERCTISNSTAVGNGGAVYADNDVTVLDSEIIGNTSEAGGGAIWSRSRIQIERSRIADNSAAQDGGAILATGPVQLIDSEISGNTTASKGGGLRVSHQTSLLRTQVTGNEAGSDGGGIHNDGQLTLEWSRLADNLATLDGGGINNTLNASSSNGTATLLWSTVASNTARWGGAINNDRGRVSLLNATLANNVAAAGGAMHSYLGIVAIDNSTIAGNLAQATQGGGINNNGAAVELRNSIVADNAAGTIADDCKRQAGTIELDHTLLGSGTTCVTGGNAILTGDAGLAPLTTPVGGEPEWFPLLPGSIAIDAGDSTLTPGQVYLDQAGRARVHGAEVDLGAFEVAAVDVFSDGFE